MIMGKTLFFRCEGCGNFVTFIGGKTMCTPKCCGEPMTQLVPNTTDAATEKHVPVVTAEGNKVSVQVGSAIHPMTEKHYIQFIYLETEKGGQIRCLTPEDEPKAEFLVAEGDKPVSVYEYCNLHGLWEKTLAEPEKEPTRILVAYFTTGGVRRTSQRRSPRLQVQTCSRSLRKLLIRMQTLTGPTVRHVPTRRCTMRHPVRQSLQR